MDSMTKETQPNFPSKIPILEDYGCYLASLFLYTEYRLILKKRKWHANYRSTLSKCTFNGDYFHNKQCEKVYKLLNHMIEEPT